ncbi:MAG: hypothetical protein AAF349_21595, partial [Cyanobacteria bacterium P01_A01_bin.68]
VNSNYENKYTINYARVLNAIEGRGGNIKIKGAGLFLSPDSTITATSERGVDGTVEIDVPDSNLEDALRINPEHKPIGFSRICGRPGAPKNSFVILGKGGIPDTPEDALGGGSVWYDNTLESRGDSKKAQLEYQEEDIKIEEATGWVDNGDGTVTLTDSPNESIGDYLSKSNCVIEEND